MSLKDYDVSQYIKNRLKNSKDIFKVIKNLEKEGYEIIHTKTLMNNYDLVHIKKDNICVSICYTSTPEEEFKQEIRYILY